MTNHMIDHDASLRLANAWRELPEELRKQIFKAVYRNDLTFLDRIAKGFGGGFTVKKLATRPAMVVARLDNQLITVNGGKELGRLMKKYFTECNRAINDTFIYNFNILLKKSPEISSKQITENVLAILHSEFKDDQLWNLYENALPVCEPSRFSDDPADPMELSSDNEMTSHTFYDEPIPDDALALQNVPTSRDQHHDLLKEDSIASRNLKPSNNHDRKSTLPASRTKTDSSSTSVYEYITAANIGEVIDQVSHKLKTMPIAAAEKILQLYQTTISSLTREYKEYLTRLSELDHQLTEVRSLGLIHVNVSNKAFSAPFSQLPISEATDGLLQSISQARSILDKHKRFLELKDILDIAHKPELCRFDKPELGKLLNLVDRRLADLEKLFHDRVISESLLLDFVARLESCDYATARQFVAEITPEVWENLVRAALLFGNSSGQMVDKITADKQSTFIATSILRDPLLMSLILSVAWQASSTVGFRILNLLTESPNPMGIRVLGVALSGLIFEQLQIVAADSPHLAKEISRLTLLSVLAHHNLDAIRWLQSISSNDTSATSAEIEFFRECAISNERGCLVQDLSAAFGFVAETPPTDSCQNTATQELKSLSEVHGLGGNYRKLRESAREHYILPVMRHVEKNQADSAFKLWEGYGDYENMTQHVTKDIETAHKPEQRHLDKTIQYLHRFGVALANWVASASQPTNCPNDTFTMAFRDFVKVAGEPEKTFLSALRSVIAGKDSYAVPPAYFGRIASMAGRVSKAYVEPMCIENWIMACNSPSEETDGGDLLSERLIHVLGQTSIPPTPRAVLDQLLAKSEFIAAANLSNFYPNMNTVFSEYIEEVRKTTLKEYEASWNEAHLLISGMN